MKIHIDDLCKASNYKKSYFIKILRSKNINNYILLNEEDIKNLFKKIEVKNKKSYDLYLYLKKIIN